MVDDQTELSEQPPEHRRDRIDGEHEASDDAAAHRPWTREGIMRLMDTPVKVFITRLGTGPCSKNIGRSLSVISRSRLRSGVWASNRHLSGLAGSHGLRHFPLCTPVQRRDLTLYICTKAGPLCHCARVGTPLGISASGPSRPIQRRLRTRFQSA